MIIRFFTPFHFISILMDDIIFPILTRQTYFTTVHPNANTQQQSPLLSAFIQYLKRFMNVAAEIPAIATIKSPVYPYHQKAVKFLSKPAQIRNGCCSS